MSADLLRQLRRWGSLHGGRYDTPDIRHDEDTAPRRRGAKAQQHPMMVARQFAPGTRKRAERKLVERSGEDRRRIMARAASVKGMPVVPMWACSPITCTETRAKGPRREVETFRPQGFSGAVEMPDDLAWIDRALVRLNREQPVLGAVIRQEFQEVGSQVGKAAQIQRAYGGNFSRYHYAIALGQAIGWMEANRPGKLTRTG